MHSVLITGAQGFIGRNLVTTLRKEKPDLELSSALERGTIPEKAED